MIKQKIQVVWFKRDLRMNDNPALAQASNRGEVLLLYILEPELWKQQDLSLFHWQFLLDCLDDLKKELYLKGHKLIIKVGDAVEVLQEIANSFEIEAIWSNQETWNGWTYNRDKAIKKWTKSLNISWYEPYQNGVVRLLKNRDNWSKAWYSRMSSKIENPGIFSSLKNIKSDEIPSSIDFGIKYINTNLIQKGGRQEALKLVYSFLNERGHNYTKEMSSPVTAYDSCSRISPYLAFGCISIREVFQLTQEFYKTLDISSKRAQSIRSFLSRLRWHCHFIQKLEDEPRLEFENLHPAYADIRVNQFNENYFQAWKEGVTGFPLIDACMRALVKTGWLNFRMRAMLVSFASYHLWLDWQKTSIHLANIFTDYEPGIHYSQVQMQSGTTGINAIRIYNPLKQSLDQDENGIFIKKWIPELRDTPLQYIHRPWEYSGNKYPKPIVDERIARQEAAKKIYRLRRDDQHKLESKKIAEKHASRKGNFKKHNDGNKLYKQLELKFT